MNEESNFQIFLNSYFLEIKSRNPAFSLRAFAKKTKISHSALSEIMNGKRNVSAKLASRVLDNLMVDPDQKESIVSRLEGRPIHTRQEQILRADEFSVISDWIHYALLTYFEIKSCTREDLAEVGKKFSVSKSRIEKAVSSLMRLELLTEDEHEVLIPTGNRLNTSDDIANTSLRKSHHNNLELAAKALDEVPVLMRDFSALTLSLNKEKIPEIKLAIKKFQDEIYHLCEHSNKDEVYKMCVQLFPLTELN